MEEGDTARFVVTLSPASDQTVTVRYKTADGTADEGTDYRGVSRTLTFVPDDTEQTILVWSHEDDVDEPDRNVYGGAEQPDRRDPGGRECDGHDHRVRRVCAAAQAFHC